MGNDIQGINYESVLADLEARKAKLEAAIESIREIIGQISGGPSSGPGTLPPGAKPAHDAFIGMSIPEATKKHLGMVRRKLSTQEIMTALTDGGLPESKYNVVYAILRRREKQVGDVINMKGDWALAEWYPNYKKKSKTDSPSTESETHDAEDIKAEAS